MDLSVCVLQLTDTPTTSPATIISKYEISVLTNISLTYNVGLVQFSGVCRGRPIMVQTPPNTEVSEQRLKLRTTLTKTCKLQMN